MKSFIKKLALFIVTAAAFVAIAVACAPVKILNTITPSSSFEREKNISYGDKARQKLDVYRAETPRANGDAPVLVFVHGGSWDSGDKGIYKFLAEGFTAEGFDVVMPNYRLFPDAHFPDMIEDVGKAIAFTAEKFAGRPLVVMGHSAGGYNTLMAIQRPEFYPGGERAICSRIAGLVLLAPPTGIVALKKEPYITIFPDRFTSTDAPLNTVNGPTPPMFFGHGTADTTVYTKNSEDMVEKILARGGVAEVKLYEGQGHTEMVRVMSRHFDDEASVKADVITFIDGLDLTRENFCQ